MIMCLWKPSKPRSKRLIPIPDENGLLGINFIYAILLPQRKDEVKKLVREARTSSDVSETKGNRYQFSIFKYTSWSSEYKQR